MSNTNGKHRSLSFAGESELRRKAAAIMLGIYQGSDLALVDRDITQIELERAAEIVAVVREHDDALAPQIVRDAVRAAKQMLVGRAQRLMLSILGAAEGESRFQTMRIPRPCHIINIVPIPKPTYASDDEARAALPNDDLYAESYFCDAHQGWHNGHHRGDWESDKEGMKKELARLRAMEDGVGRLAARWANGDDGLSHAAGLALLDAMDPGRHNRQKTGADYAAGVKATRKASTI